MHSTRAVRRDLHAGSAQVARRKVEQELATRARVVCRQRSTRRERACVAARSTRKQCPGSAQGVRTARRQEVRGLGSAHRASYGLTGLCVDKVVCGLTGLTALRADRDVCWLRADRAKHWRAGPSLGACGMQAACHAPGSKLRPGPANRSAVHTETPV